MTFKVGDKVVHPQYGVGHVAKLEDREFEPGVMRRYYEIAIPGSTLWVPLDLPSLGLRKLTVKSEIERCRQILSSRPASLAEDARLRQSDLSARLKEGTIAAFLRVTQDVLCQEWAAVEGITLAEAVVEVSFLLEKSKLTLTETET